MARIRTIKPEMWESEKLGKLSVVSRLTFIGLISMADDTGRGRGSVTFLRGRIHAYASDVSDQTCFEAMRDLERAGVVQFYSIDGCCYYSLPNWCEHQYIERPKKSSIPKPNTESLSLFGDGEGMLRGFITTGREGNGTGNGMEQGREEHIDPPPLPDEIQPKVKTGAAKSAHAAIQTIWNELAHGSLPRCKEIGSGERLKSMKARWSEHPDESYWRMTVNNMNAQAFCLGENDRRWMANMDFLLRPESSIKINEGAYLKPEEARKFKCCGRCKREGSWIKGRSKNGKTSLCADCMKKEDESEVNAEQPKETTPCQPSKES
jgi:hypothetical protein